MLVEQRLGTVRVPARVESRERPDPFERREVRERRVLLERPHHAFACRGARDLVSPPREESHACARSVRTRLGDEIAALRLAEPPSAALGGLVGFDAGA